jgi:hypothetical protein
MSGGGIVHIADVEYVARSPERRAARYCHDFPIYSSCIRAAEA